MSVPNSQDDVNLFLKDSYYKKDKNIAVSVVSVLTLYNAKEFCYLSLL